MHICPYIFDLVACHFTASGFSGKVSQHPFAMKSQSSIRFDHSRISFSTKLDHLSNGTPLKLILSIGQ